MVPVTFLEVLKSPIGVGRHMPRDRYQRGWVEEVGRHVKKWRGHYYVYRIGPDGKEKRHHKTATLGLKGQMDKWQAAKALQEIIEREQAPIGESACTLCWFFEKRYLPMHEPSLKKSSRENLRWVMEKHILAKFGSTPLADIERFEMQCFLNELAEEKYSRSTIHQARTYLSAILEEALYQGFVRRNEAKLLEKPRVAEAEKRYLKPAQCRAMLDCCSGRDGLMLRLLLLCGLRPGELFVLRWDDYEPGLLRIDERIYRGEIDLPKTTRSAGYVALPANLDRDITSWREVALDQGPRAWMFPSEVGTPILPGNWLNRNLKEAAAKVKLEFVNYQIIRRTFATLIQKHGTIKDAQAQLRHANPNVTLAVYMQAIPESLKAAVDSLEMEIARPNPPASREIN